MKGPKTRVPFSEEKKATILEHLKKTAPIGAALFEKIVEVKAFISEHGEALGEEDIVFFSSFAFRGMDAFLANGQDYDGKQPMTLLTSICGKEDTLFGTMAKQILISEDLFYPVFLLLFKENAVPISAGLEVMSALFPKGHERAKALLEEAISEILDNRFDIKGALNDLIGNKDPQ